jgi:hypothetical protein
MGAKATGLGCLTAKAGASYIPRLDGLRPAYGTVAQR